MEVSHKSEHVTHAAFGVGVPIEYDIASTPEFYRILYKSVYTNQELAVVREVLCNAWDAHIEAGITNVPIEVKIQGLELIIQDFGLGIPREKIGPVYGRYGGTTKLADGAQTGGFGLGAKAPFAYAEHFEVTSCHEGVKTIYNMSRSSAQADGKPSILPILSVPTTERGLKVKIQIKNSADQSHLEALAKQVIRSGDILANLNDVLMKQLGMSFDPGSYVIDIVPPYSGDKNINVRYGNVVYPVPQHDSYSKAYGDVAQFLRDMNNNHSFKRRYLILQAAPHSLSVAPSREALSMQENTIFTMAGLLNDFSRKLQEENHHHVMLALHELNDAAVRDMKLGQLLLHLNQPVITRSWGDIDNLIVRDMQDLGRHTVLARYNYYRSIRWDDKKIRLRKMVEKGIGPKGTIQSFSRMIDSWGTGLSSSQREHAAHDWYMKTIIRKLVRDIVSLVPGGSLERFQVVHPSVKQLIPAHKFAPNNIEGWLPILRKMVVLTFSRKDYLDFASNFPQLGDLGPLGQGSFIYTVTRSRKGSADAAREIFTRHGFNVLDLTVEQPWAVRDDEPRERNSHLAPRGVRAILPWFVSERTLGAPITHRISRLAMCLG